MADLDERGAAAQNAGNVPQGESEFLSGTRKSFMCRVFKAIQRRASAILWRSRMARFGQGASIAGPSWILNPAAIEIGKRVSVWHHARIEAICSPQNVGAIRLNIGDDAVIQPYAHIGAAHRVTIGKHAMIASYVYITDHDHDLSDPMDPASVNSRLITAPVRIGDYTWLGEKVMVLKGVTIGERSIIGAGSVVTRDIPPMSIAVGSPAKVIRRYNEQTGRWVGVTMTEEG